MSRSLSSSQAQLSPEKPKDLKVVFVGESNVGKTSILTLANTGEFEDSCKKTVCVYFLVNSYVINGRNIKLNLWDTAGTERYRSLTPIFFRDLDVAILVYAIDDIRSFDEVKCWRDSILNELGYTPEMYLIGNKSDLESERKVTFEMGERLAQEIGARFYEVSAKCDDGTIPNIMLTIAKNESLKINEVNVSPPLQSKIIETTQKNNCCE